VFRRLMQYSCLSSLALISLWGEPPPVENAGPPASSGRVQFGAEFRGRLELPAALDFTDGKDDQFYLHRIRLWAGLEVFPWMRLHIEGQDARTLGYDDPDGLSSVVHRLDFRQLNVNLGNSRRGSSLTLGRQELAFGEERLIGADNYWDPLGMTFDAVRFTRVLPAFRIDAFSALVVPCALRGMAAPSLQDQLYGVYASSSKGYRGAVVETYLLAKRNPARDEGLSHFTENRIFTYGGRTAGQFGEPFEYNVEMALQSGHRDDQAIRAWMGHWEIGLRPLRGERAPRFSAEYNFASGDHHAGDRHYNTFDDLYPAGYNKFGMADPFAGRNLRGIGGSAEWRLSRRWLLAGSYRAFWLASISDGLYIKGDDVLTLNPRATSDHVGDQATLLAAWTLSENWQVYGGYARFFPGSFLADSHFYGHLSTPYLMLNYKFAR